jgi:heme-degrading monooxygenase HmoA
VPALSRARIIAAMSRLSMCLLVGLVTACASRTPAPQAPQAPRLCGARIARVWHGRTPNAKADAYAAYITPAITKFATIPGNLGYQLLRETVGDETHFTVISYWASRDAIHGYAGADISATRALPDDHTYLIDPEPKVKNYDLVVQALGCPAS